MEFHHVFILLLLARCVTAGPDLLYMSTMCGETKNVGAMGVRLNSQISSVYSSNIDCSLTITAPAGLQLILTVDSLDLEELTYSCTDSLYVYDGVFQIKLIRQICGFSEWEVPDIVSTSGALTLHFTSDDSVQHSGFSLSLTPFKTAPCIDTDYSYKCNNDRCINPTLTSDFYDNCGDNSDVGLSDTVLDDDLGDAIEGVVRLAVGIIVAIVVGCILVAVLVSVGCGCLCYHACCKDTPRPQQTSYQVMTNPQPQQVTIIQPPGQAAYPLQQQPPPAYVVNT